MKKVFLLISVLVSILVVSSCAQPQPAEVSPPQEKETLRVEVNRFGFNATPGEFRLKVEEGQEVTIAFIYGYGDLLEDNPHIIGALDYDIDTGLLSQTNPEITLRFTAKETGEIVFACIRPQCVGHHNLHGDVEEEHHEEEEHHGQSEAEWELGEAIVLKPWPLTLGA